MTIDFSVDTLLSILIVTVLISSVMGLIATFYKESKFKRVFDRIIPWIFASLALFLYFLVVKLVGL